MTTLYTSNGAAYATSDGALVANPCASLSDPCICADACSALTTRYRYHSCCNNGTGYNHAGWAVFGTIARDGCHYDCCTAQSAASRTFPRPVNPSPPDYGVAYPIYVGGIALGQGSADLCNRTFSYSTPTEWRYIGGAPLPEGICETRLDSHLVNPNDDPDVPGPEFLRIGGTYLHDCWYPVAGCTGRDPATGLVWTPFPFFHSISAGTSRITFLQTTTCNAGGQTPGATVEHGWHEFTWRFSSAAGARFVVKLDGTVVADVSNGASTDVVKQFEQLYSGPEFTLEFAVSAA